MNAVDARDLFRVYSTSEGDAVALQGLSLTVGAGELVAVLGPSGAGKSTLLRLLAGFDRPSAGTLLVLGVDVGKLQGRALARYRARMLGYADQHYEHALAPDLTARENVGLRLRLRGETTRVARTRADELLEQVGLADRRDARPAELSGGEQQRVALATALTIAPPLLLLDEPAGELDATNANVVYSVVSERARAHRCTTVLVSHDPESTRIADRTIRIRDGRVSEETLRHGAADTIVVGRGGWLRLPEDYLRHVGIRDRATAHLEDDRIVVDATQGGMPAPTGDGSGPAAPPPEPRPQVRPRRGLETVRLEAVTKSYGWGETASVPIDSLSARLEAGRLYALTGPSGSGKTTLLNLLAGLELPTAGRIHVAGTEITGLERTARARFRRDTIALLAQQGGLIGFLSARENVELALALRGHRVDETSAVEPLVTVGLADRLAQRADRLSSGEQVRVSLARALAARPALLLADEPTARLDTANALNVTALLARIAAESGATVVCATHDPLIVEQADAEVPLGSGTYSVSPR